MPRVITDIVDVISIGKTVFLPNTVLHKSKESMMIRTENRNIVLSVALLTMNRLFHRLFITVAVVVMTFMGSKERSFKELVREGNSSTGAHGKEEHSHKYSVQVCFSSNTKSLYLSLKILNKNELLICIHVQICKKGNFNHL